MNFSPFNSHTNELFLKNKIIKLMDIINIEKVNLAFQFNQRLLPDDIMNLFQYNTNSYNTRNMSSGGLRIPPIRTDTYGNKSLRYSVPYLWNIFINQHDHSKFKSVHQIRQYLKKFYIDSYVNAP